MVLKIQKKNLPRLKNEKKTYVLLQGSHFQQNNAIIKNNSNVINIYCVYKLDPISTSRDDTFSLQNVLFGAMQITKNADTSKYKYKGYGTCFDGDSLFSVGDINNGRISVIFGVHEGSVTNSNNKANNIFLWVMVLCKGLMALPYMQKKRIVKTLLNLV